MKLSIAALTAFALVAPILTSPAPSPDCPCHAPTCHVPACPVKAPECLDDHIAKKLASTFEYFKEHLDIHVAKEVLMEGFTYFSDSEQTLKVADGVRFHPALARLSLPPCRLPLILVSPSPQAAKTLLITTIPRKSLIMATTTITIIIISSPGVLLGRGHRQTPLTLKTSATAAPESR